MFPIAFLTCAIRNSSISGVSINQIFPSFLNTDFRWQPIIYANSKTSLLTQVLTQCFTKTFPAIILGMPCNYEAEVAKLLVS